VILADPSDIFLRPVHELGDLGHDGVHFGLAIAYTVLVLRLDGENNIGHIGSRVVIMHTSGWASRLAVAVVAATIIMTMLFVAATTD
jgi:hypothetical protein